MFAADENVTLRDRLVNAYPIPSNWTHRSPLSRTCCWQCCGKKRPVTGASGASLSGALLVVICWQNWLRPKAMMLRRRVRFDASLMGPPILHTAWGEQPPAARPRDAIAVATRARLTERPRIGGKHSVITSDR